MSRDFIRANKAFWSESQTDAAQVSGVVFSCAMESHPVNLITNAAFTTTLARARKLKPVYVIDSSRHAGRRSIIESYGPCHIIDMSDWRHSILRQWVRREAHCAWRAFKTPWDILDFESDGIRFGDAIYDAILAEGYATVDCVDKRSKKCLERFYFLRAMIRDIIRRFDIRASVFVHPVGSWLGSVWSRYLIRDGVELFNPFGAERIFVRKCRSFDDLGNIAVTPPAHDMECMDQETERVVREAEKYLDQRQGGRIDHPAVHAVYGAQKRVYTDPCVFARDYGLKSSNTIVFVMLHAFNDYPHSHFWNHRLIFQDYYDWFLKTLEIARTTPQIQWVFREHPGAKYYKTRDCDVREIMQGVHEEHISFMPCETNFNARSIAHIGHAIITCIGTAGLEFAPHGVPCVLGGRSGYEGFGFTEEPQTLADYENCLRNIDQLRPLNKVQRDNALKLLFYGHQALNKIENALCPSFTSAEVHHWSADLETEFWETAVLNLQNPQQVKATQELIYLLTDFINDPVRTHLIDLIRYPFFKKEALLEVTA